MLINDFNERFHDLKAMVFHSWLTQPLLLDLLQYQSNANRNYVGYSKMNS